MPHSSGGGSHGGGSHGGSHSGGRGGSGTNRHHSSTYFAGARHYVYYKNRRPVHFYSDVEINEEYIKKRKRTWLAIKICLICFYSIFALGMIGSMIFGQPEKLSQECIDPNQIIDTTAMISEEEQQQIMTQIDEFKNKTGISVTILTVNDEIWNENFVSLEKYAYDYYVTNLNDEKNWLIVYSESMFQSDFNNWKWEGMQGDDTDSILTSSSTDKFNDAMHKNISRDGFAKAVSETFDYYNDIVMEASIDIFAVVVATLGMGVHASIFFLVFWLGFGAPIKSEEQAIELVNPQATYVEATCEYCGGLFLHGVHTSCPHCGGAIKPLNNQL